MTIALWVLAGLVLLCGLFLFLLAPRPRREEGIAPLLGWDYAHRGLFDNESGPPENSLPAFARAVEGGYGIELDVQLSRDGKLVVFHDDDLARMCSAEGRVDSYSYEELREMPLLGSGERIPLFTEVLELVAGRVPLIVELKMSPVNNYPVCEAANRILSGYRGAYCVESFSPLAVRWYRKHRPDVVRGQLSDRMRAEEGGLAAPPGLLWSAQPPDQRGGPAGLHRLLPQRRASDWLPSVPRTVPSSDCGLDHPEPSGVRQGGEAL